jgi:hypothetical protein
MIVPISTAPVEWPTRTPALLIGMENAAAHTPNHYCSTVPGAPNRVDLLIKRQDKKMPLTGLLSGKLGLPPTL